VGDVYVTEFLVLHSYTRADWTCILTYIHTCAAAPVDFHMLTNLMKKVSHEVVGGGGIVRAIHNHGIRDLPHRFKAKFPDKQGNRYYQKGRFISVYYDSNPATMRQVEQVLTMDEEVLRNTHLKTRSILDFVNITREERNPYIKEAKKIQKEERKDTAALNDTIEHTIEDMRLDS
jgi:ribosomal protein S6